MAHGLCAMGPEPACLSFPSAGKQNKGRKVFEVTSLIAWPVERQVRGGTAPFRKFASGLAIGLLLVPITFGLLGGPRFAWLRLEGGSATSGPPTVSHRLPSPSGEGALPGSLGVASSGTGTPHTRPDNWSVHALTEAGRTRSPGVTLGREPTLGAPSHPIPFVQGSPWLAPSRGTFRETILPAPHKRAGGGAKPSAWEDMIEVRLSVHDPKCWTSALPGDPSVQVDVRARSVAHRTVHELLEVVGPRAATLEALDAIQAHFPAAEIRSRGLSPRRGLAFVDVRGCNACRLCESSGALLRGLALGKEGGLDCTITADNRSTMKAVLGRLTGAGLRPVVVRAGMQEPDSPLTSRQREVVRLASAMGFFDEPRRAGLGEVGRGLGVSRQTVVKVLRTAERRILKLI